MQHIIHPVDEREVASMIQEAADTSMALEVLGAGSKRSVGRPVDTSAAISTARIYGITFYEPAELVISAKAGTQLATIQNTLANHNQMLAFEPIDLGPALGQDPHQATIGGVFATNLCGARRVVAGAARDHLTGIRAVNGQGEIFKSGGRVMKNVTGYDLCKAVAGSWGTLGIMTEVTMKVLPAPEQTNTIILRGPPDQIAVEALCMALATPTGVTGTVHLQKGLCQSFSDPLMQETDEATTVIRVENFADILPRKVADLKDLLGHYGELELLDNERSLILWEEMRQLKFLQGNNNAVWRLSTAPQNGVSLMETIRIHHPEIRAAFDWSGGLVWLIMPTMEDPGSFEVRRAISEYGGHATLLRADTELRVAADVFQPQEDEIQRLTKRIKSAFDPLGILNPGRMYAGI